MSSSIAGEYGTPAQAVEYWTTRMRWLLPNVDIQVERQHAPGLAEVLSVRYFIDDGPVRGKAQVGDVFGLLQDGRVVRVKLDNSFAMQRDWDLLLQVALSATSFADEGMIGDPEWVQIDGYWLRVPLEITPPHVCEFGLVTRAPFDEVRSYVRAGVKDVSPLPAAHVAARRVEERLEAGDELEKAKAIAAMREWGESLQQAYVIRRRQPEEEWEDKAPFELIVGAQMAGHDGTWAELELSANLDAKDYSPELLHAFDEPMRRAVEAISFKKRRAIER